MTVAAVILSSTSEEALAPTQAQPRVRRLVDIAWAGGALPVVVMTPDADGAVARALVGSEAVHGPLASAAAGVTGAATDLARGIDLAISEVRETSAVLVWPVAMSWVGPETVTSLIEAHGVEPTVLLRPAWQDQPGWPVLIPITYASMLPGQAVDATLPVMVDTLAAALPARLLDLGDPGTVFDAGTPASELPAYVGPVDPPAGHTHEWGQDVEAEAGFEPPDQET